jgi:hypothetical protein
MEEQIIGILDDWKAQQFGGEPIIEAINKLTAISGASARQELARIAEGIQTLTEVIASQEAAPSPQLTAALLALGGGGVGGGPLPTPSDPSDDARAEIRRNVEEISQRMGGRLGTGDEALPIGDSPTITLSDRDPILPVPLRAGGEATIYGAGLENVTEIAIDEQVVTIGRILPGEIDFTVPAEVSAGTVEVDVVSRDTIIEFQIEVVGGIETTQKSSRKGVKS